MALTREQRTSLEEAGIRVVSLKLATYGGGKGSFVGGFKCGEILRGDIEGWLAAKTKDEQSQQDRTLKWAQIAGWAGIASVVIAIAALLLPFVSK